MNKNKIMSHMVAFYPDRKNSLEVARALIEGGSSYLEIQFPFTDPSADGVFIQMACKKALEEGFTIDKGFKLIGEIQNFESPNRFKPPIFIMSYANLVFFKGIKNFLQQCASVGVEGLIVPDLPPDLDEGLYSNGREFGIKIVPVIMPNIIDERLNMIMSLSPEYLYTAIRRGTTGKFTEIDSSIIDFLNKVGEFGPKILAGFGISNKSQVDALSPFIHASVVGSAFIREIEGLEARDEVNIYNAVFDKIKKLI